MKKILLLSVMIAVFQSHATADEIQSFTVTEVGVSKNSGTVFINTLENATTTCITSNQFKVSFSDSLVDKFYTAAITAHISGKQLEINYDPDGCEGWGVAPIVFVLK